MKPWATHHPDHRPDHADSRCCAAPAGKRGGASLTWRNPVSQTAKILKHLQAGKPITPLIALRRYGCLRLAARIAELRKDHSIVTHRAHRGGKTFAAYRMA